MKTIIAFCFAILLISCGKASKEEAELHSKIDSLKTEIFELQKANDTLSDHLMKKAYTTRQYSTFFDSINDPEAYLLKKLRENPELVPKEAVLGGTMRFTSVSFVNDEIFIAEYEDGHIMGKGIYRYSIDGNAKLHFTLITTLDY